ncbi:hypothetical protein F4778DRAFT_734532 [Xylariomycetidae sp. FL2044]|nr:hypothetical protein F4778DRAFT_734532 [Xylariomycetidae sp. FL2044]
MLLMLLLMLLPLLQLLLLLRRRTRHCAVILSFDVSLAADITHHSTPSTWDGTMELNPDVILDCPGLFALTIIHSLSSKKALQVPRHNIYTI